MVTLNAIKPAGGASRPAKRLGRGVGSGWGKTAGRGHNGAGSRRGSTSKPYFEGGQTSLIRRIPKRGFNNIFRKTFQTVNLSSIEKLECNEKEINSVWLYQQGLVRSASLPVKILGNGDFSKSLIIKANAFSATAREKIEKAKGKAEVI